MTLDRWIVRLLMLCAGCASIKSDTRIVEYPEGTQHIDQMVAGSRTYRAAAEIEVINLVVKLSTKATCGEADIPIIRRKRVITRSEVPTPFGIPEKFLAGAGGLVLGGLITIDPERACTSTDQSGSASTTDPQACASLGLALIGVGALITAVAITDSIRTMDAEQDLGAREGEYKASTHECLIEPAANTAVELQLGDHAISLPGKTTEDGEVTFPMLDVWDDIRPSTQAPAKILIGDTVVPVVVTDQQRRELSASLRGNPRSRVAQDLADGARKSCEQAVDRADQIHITADSDDIVISASRDAWQHAKATCSTLWITDYQSKHDAAEKAIAENRVGSAFLALNAGDPDALDKVLANDPGVLARLRADPDALQLLRTSVAASTRALVSAGQNVADAQRRLCRARQLFVKIRGVDKWEQFKVEVARNVSELGGGVPSNIVRLMDAARCE